MFRRHAQASVARRQPLPAYLEPLVTGALVLASDLLTAGEICRSEPVKESEWTSPSPETSPASFRRDGCSRNDSSHGEQRERTGVGAIRIGEATGRRARLNMSNVGGAER
jgi:hypothetical protein